MDINGKVAVVTGSSSGVGEATAKLLASLGASVVVNYFRGAESGQRVVDEIQAAGGCSHRRPSRHPAPTPTAAG